MTPDFYETMMGALAMVPAFAGWQWTVSSEGCFEHPNDRFIEAACERDGGLVEVSLYPSMEGVRPAVEWSVWARVEMGRHDDVYIDGRGATLAEAVAEALSNARRCYAVLGGLAHTVAEARADAWGPVRRQAEAARRRFVAQVAGGAR